MKENSIENMVRFYETRSYGFLKTNKKVDNIDNTYITVTLEDSSMGLIAQAAYKMGYSKSLPDCTNSDAEYTSNYLKKSIEEDVYGHILFEKYGSLGRKNHVLWISNKTLIKSSLLNHRAFEELVQSGRQSEACDLVVRPLRNMRQIYFNEEDLQFYNLKLIELTD